MNMNLKLTGLEPVEVASRDQLLTLQLERLKWSLQHAYDNIAHYRTKFDKAGVHPRGSEIAGRSRQIPVHHQGRPARELSLRDVRRADAGYRSGACFVRHHRQANSGRLYRTRYRHVGVGDGALAARGRRDRRRHRPQFLWLRPVHRRARRTLRRRASRRGRDSDVGRPDREAGADDPGLQAHRADVHAVLFADHRRRIGSPGHQAGQHQSAHRRVRRRTLDQRNAQGDRGAPRHRRDRHLRPVRGRSDRAWPAKPSRPRTVRISGKTIFIPRSSIPSAARCCRTGPTANWCSPP